MRTRSLSLVVLLLVLAAVGCGDKEPAKTPETSSSPPTDPTSTPATTGSTAAADPPAKPRKPFEIYSSCTDVVTVVFGADPKAANVGKRTIAPSSSIEGARDADGNQVVWLLDTNGEPLIKVHVSRGMKKVEIGKSCRTLDAK
jgi:hypothetical protein